MTPGLLSALGKVGKLASDAVIAVPFPMFFSNVCDFRSFHFSKLFSVWFKRWSQRTWLRTRGPKSKQGKPYQHWNQQVTQHQHRNQNCSFLTMISREIATRIKIPLDWRNRYPTKLSSDTFLLSMAEK